MFYKIVVDSTYFHISVATLKQNKECLLSKVVLDGHKDNRIFIDDDTVYVDMDPESFKIILTFLRNYPIDGVDITNRTLIEKVLSTTIL